MNLFGIIINPYGAGVVTALLVYMPAALVALTLARHELPRTWSYRVLWALHAGSTTVVLLALVLVVFYVPAALRERPVTFEDYSSLIKLLNWTGLATLVAEGVLMFVLTLLHTKLRTALSTGRMVMMSAMFLQVLVAVYVGPALSSRGVEYAYAEYKLEFVGRPIWFDYTLLALWGVLSIGIAVALLTMWRRRSPKRSKRTGGTWWQWLLYGFAHMSYWPVESPREWNKPDEPEDDTRRSIDRT